MYFAVFLNFLGKTNRAVRAALPPSQPPHRLLRKLLIQAAEFYKRTLSRRAWSARASTSLFNSALTVSSVLYETSCHVYKY